MKICIVGSGAMGGLYGARLIMAGEEVVFVDSHQSVVDKINNQGLHLTGVDGEHWIPAVASTQSSNLHRQILFSFIPIPTIPRQRLFMLKTCSMPTVDGVSPSKMASATLRNCRKNWEHTEWPGVSATTARHRPLQGTRFIPTPVDLDRRDQQGPE